MDKDSRYFKVVMTLTDPWSVLSILSAPARVPVAVYPISGLAELPLCSALQKIFSSQWTSHKILYVQFLGGLESSILLEILLEINC